VQTRYPAPFFEPISLLGYLAGVTDRVELGTTVLIVPYRNPLEIAKACAHIDQLSGGRFILGVGVGWAQDEFQALKVPFRSRGAITNEYLEAVKLLWTEDAASFEGKFTSFSGYTPRPSRCVHPTLPSRSVGPVTRRCGVRSATVMRGIPSVSGWTGSGMSTFPASGIS